MSLGSLYRIAATLSRRSAAASLGLRSIWNRATDHDRPSRLKLLIDSSPAAPEMASSTGLVTRASTSWGAAPGYSTLMSTTGNSTLGNRSLDNLVAPKMPSTIIRATIMVVRTGRRMNGAEKLKPTESALVFMSPSPPPAAGFNSSLVLTRGPPGLLPRDLHRVAVLQEVGTLLDDGVPGRQAAADLDLP